MVGNICLAPAGDFEFGAKAVESERLETAAGAPKALKTLSIAPGDWPTYRADNTRSAAGPSRIPVKVECAWRHQPPKGVDSTAPVTAGGMVFVGDGVVYAAAGIASYDGTHVYALDAGTGRIQWQNNTSGHFFGGDRVTGVSVQGHLLLHENRLYMAGGNVISPAVYDTRGGRCLNKLVDEWGGQVTGHRSVF